MHQLVSHMLCDQCHCENKPSENITYLPMPEEESDHMLVITGRMPAHHRQSPDM